MDPLARQLMDSGALDEPAVAWATRYQTEHGVSFDSALLALDLIDEGALLGALEACFRLKAARPDDLTQADGELGRRFPIGFSRSFGLCPLGLRGTELIALVNAPLPTESIQELSDLFGLSARLLVAPEHYLTLGRARVYGIAADQRTLDVEARLSARRRADVRQPLEAVAGAPSFAAAAREVLSYAAHLVEHACFLACSAKSVRVVAASDAQRAAALPAIDPACAFYPAIRNGGFYFAHPTGTEAERAFFAALGRPVPRAALVAPVGSSGSANVVLCADNGERGIARRWVAELTLLCARLGQRRNADATLQRRAAAPEPAAVVPPEPTPTSAAHAVVEPVLTDSDRAAVDRLRTAAIAEGLTLEAFVDRLLGQRTAQPSLDTTAVLAGEVKGLFERLATDIPAHLARGMEAAFRDLVPRLAPAPMSPAPIAPAAITATASPVATAASSVGIEIVAAPSAPREVPSYESRRRKSPRVKL